ncbi:hypothetical protein VE00_07909 [Pseudogymnoascus sp. WSF 3629]|nr:hypothetical protein VE00_07909 [Pseudogymnoascus sp. WSF 3629]
MANTFMQPSNSTATPQSHSPTPEEQNMPHRGRVYWATIMGNSITTAEPVSPAISWVVKDPDCPLGCDKSSTSTTCAFAPAQSPQLARRSGNQQMPPMETSMPANNSKRPHADMDSSDSGQEDNADGQDIIWTIEHLRNPVASTSRRGKDQRKGALDLRYIVEPATWLGMRNYTECIVGGVSYRKNDYVYVRHADLELVSDDDNRRFWFAHILEIRAKCAWRVYALIAWMYWPDELLGAHMGTETPTSGRHWYHGKHELVASNHLDVLDVNSMAGHAPVAQWFEDDDDNTQDGFYWRQTFNIMSRGLSGIRKYCICENYYNPDFTLVACPNEECRLWMHEECIVNNSKTKTYHALPANSEETEKHKGSDIKGLSVCRPHNRFTRKNDGNEVRITDSRTKKTATENLYSLSKDKKAVALAGNVDAADIRVAGSVALSATEVNATILQGQEESTGLAAEGERK